MVMPNLSIKYKCEWKASRPPFTMLEKTHNPILHKTF